MGLVRSDTLVYKRIFFRITLAYRCFGMNPNLEDDIHKRLTQCCRLGDIDTGLFSDPPFLLSLLYRSLLALSSFFTVRELLMQVSETLSAMYLDRAFQLACGYGHAKIVELLLQDKRVSPSAQGHYGFRHAAKNGHADVLKILLEGNYLLFFFKFKF